MTHPTRRELLRVLEEVCAQSPGVRLGQLITNLSYLARGPAVESTWDVEDDELLQAARKHMEELRSRHVSVA